MISDCNPKQVIPRSGLPPPWGYIIAREDRTGHSQNLLVRAASFRDSTGFLHSKLGLSAAVCKGLPLMWESEHLPPLEGLFACPAELGCGYLVGFLSAHPPPPSLGGGCGGGWGGRRETEKETESEARSRV